MHPVSFVLCLHNHQPEGNFDSVFAEATEKSYAPFLRLLRSFPEVKVSLHFTGILLDWLERNDPRLLELLAALVERGQVEMLGGAFHEPVLAAIPRADRIGQMRKLSAWIDDRFGSAPRAMWLAERIWEQSLASDIVEAGYECTLLDDSHFLYAGVAEQDLHGYYMTEDQGRAMALFPINQRLRYLIPFAAPEEAIAWLYRLASTTPDAVAVYGDDGEKFGLWPRTFEHVWAGGWLRRFFEALSRNRSWLHTAHLGEVLRTHAPRGRLYLPDASYEEMMHWSLPTAAGYQRYESFKKELTARGQWGAFRSLVRGGFWRNFMVKYPEINQMHKHMLRVSSRIEALAPVTSDTRYVEARDALYAAQCNCAYWHGVFGGVYLPHIRSTVFRNLVRAEALLDDIESVDAVRTTVGDADLDGRPDIIVDTPSQQWWFTPADGGKVVEVDSKRSAMNIIDVMTRREEGYHRLVRDAVVTGNGDAESRSIHDVIEAKEEGLHEHLAYDWYRRGMFIDHVLDADSTLAQFRAARHNELGDFANQAYEFSVDEDVRNTVVRLWREGGVWRDGVRHALRVEKEFRFTADSDTVEMRYALHNLAESPIALRFCIEVDYNLLAGDAPDKYYEIENTDLGSDNKAGSEGVSEGIQAFAVTNAWDGWRAELRWDAPAALWRCPIETVSLSEAGFERSYQGSAVLLLFDVHLTDTWELRAQHTVTTLPPGQV
ncbi:MAG TPA: DUF1926 domain-containing protein [Bacteroidota bacterium]|nr:DUF1926 domain-containing protein [Bacteroidota bacterium]